MRACSFETGAASSNQSTRHHLLAGLSHADRTDRYADVLLHEIDIPVNLSRQILASPALREFIGKAVKCLTCTPGWTGICGANGSGKTTLLRLIAGELAPDRGAVRMPGTWIYCAQRTDDPADGMPSFMEDMDPGACILRGKLGIDDDWLARWNSLSHGERKRLQIGHALWQSPDVLLVDEPTNHIDSRVRDLLVDALAGFDGIGLIVTHDRDLLDQLCYQCLWLDTGEATVRPGGYSAGLEAEKLERQSTMDTVKKLRAEQANLESAAERYRKEASRSHKKRSKRGLAIKDHDARFKKNRARLSGADGQDGKRLRQLDGRLAHLQEKLDSLSLKKEYEIGIWLDGRISRRDCIAVLEETDLALGENRSLKIPALQIAPDARTAVTGPNGSGKSTLVRHLLNHLSIPEEDVLYLPQEVPIRRSQEILSRLRALPNDRLGILMRIVRRLGSDPKSLLRTETPSPGELRKLLLADGIMKRPAFLVLDEPTNHLDLPSIECLETALRECPTGFLIVSHDRRFVTALCSDEWCLTEDGSTVRVERTSLGL